MRAGSLFYHDLSGRACPEVTPWTGINRAIPGTWRILGLHQQTRLVSTPGWSTKPGLCKVAAWITMWCLAGSERENESCRKGE